MSGTDAGVYSTTIIGILRLASIMAIGYNDITYTDIVPAIYSNLEPCLAISCACIPTLRPLLNRTRYSKTGTAIFGRGTVMRRTGSGHLPSDQLDKNSSQHELRPDAFQHTTGVVAKPSIPSKSSDTEMDSLGNGIHVRQEWDVERE